MPRTHSRHQQKFRGNCFQKLISLKIRTPFLNTQNGGTDVCGGMAEHFPPPPPLPPHIVFVYPTSIIRVLRPIDSSALAIGSHVHGDFPPSNLAFTLYRQ